MKVLCLGSNPGNASPDITPFHEMTRSRKVLESWFKDLDVEIYFANVAEFKTPNNRPLNMTEIKKSAPSLRKKVEGFDKVVALGKAATYAAALSGISFLEMPHPSGRNRLLNDKDFVSLKIKELTDYVDASSRP
jgi:uracil-DNA glycosylase